MIAGRRVNLRPFKHSDFDKIIEWSKDDLLSYYLGKPLPSSVEECSSRYLQTYLLRRIYAIEGKTGDVLGEIELDHISWKSRRAELFIYIGQRDFWGKGFGSDALNALIDYIFDVKGFESIYLKVYEQNSRAIKCYEKCGFKKRGLLKFKDNDHYGDNIILMEKTANRCKAI